MVWIFKFLLQIIFLILQILPMYESIYVCEQFFSTMEVKKSALCSRIIDEHLQSVLRLIYLIWSQT